MVLVNFRGADDTIEAVRRLADLDWPVDRLEIVVVENGSGDDSAARIRSAAPHVLLVESDANLGFAGGCNLGVAHTSGEFVAFLNNDAKPDPAWVSAAVAAFGESDRIGAVASRVLDWDGRLVDYVGAAMTWFGQAYKPSVGEPPPPGDRAGDVLFGTGAAMFVRREVYDALGGFDERYFMFFEDVDLGWRLNLRGWRFRYEPASLAYHRHHASMAGVGEHKEHYLLERNALFTLYKNLADRTLREALPAAMGLAVRRGIARAGADPEQFDLRRGGPDAPDIEIGAEAVAPLFAIDRFVEELPGLRAARDEIQATRTVSDEAIWALFGVADVPVLAQPDYIRGYENVTMAFDVTEPPRGTRVLIITGDPIGAKLAGPAIRAWNMASALAERHDVVLLTMSGAESVDAPFRVLHVAPGDDRRFAPLESWADVIVFQGEAMTVFAALRTTQKVVVVDIYDPMQLEHLEQSRSLGAVAWATAVDEATAVMSEQLQRGDFFLAASERQRHFYLGQLSALGRLTTTVYESDPDLRGLIDVVPFGLPAADPRHERQVLKGVRPGIGEQDRVLIWGGGLYDWFDPETLVRAVAELQQRVPDARLFFQGTRHPHPGVPEMPVVARTRALAAELGVLDRSVFLNDDWTDYADRQNWLLEADAGVSTHFAHLETTFSFRTRILDYLWAGLPMVVTEGDHFADLVEREGLGIVVPAGDVTALAAALERVLTDEPFRAGAAAAITRVRERYRWDRVLEPLLRFVDDPHPAADRAAGATVARPARARVRRSGVRHDLRRTWHYLRAGGPVVVVRKLRRRLGR